MNRPNGSPRPLELPLITLPDAHPCHACGQCCTYVAVEIDAPTAFDDYENIYWYTAHRGVSVYVDWDGDWYIEFQAVCEHLTPERTCGVYSVRPKMCSDFSSDECEITTRERAWKYRFETPDEFFSWFREKRPASFARFLKRRRQLLRKRGASPRDALLPQPR
jgi:Fe-S-cluster containining protein